MVAGYWSVDSLDKLTYDEWAKLREGIEKATAQGLTAFVENGISFTWHEIVTVREIDVPAGTRLILASENLLEDFGTRTDYGWKITAEWGEKADEGWYTPIFRSVDDGHRIVDIDKLQRALASIGIDQTLAVELWARL